MKIIACILFFVAISNIFYSGVVSDRRFTTGYKGNKLPIPMSQRLATASVIGLIGLVFWIASEVSDSVVVFWPLIWRDACCVAVAVVAYLVYPNLVAGSDKWGSTPNKVTAGRLLLAGAIAAIGIIAVSAFVKPNPEPLPVAVAEAPAPAPVAQNSSPSSVVSPEPESRTVQSTPASAQEVEPVAEAYPAESGVSTATSVAADSPQPVPVARPPQSQFSAQKLGCLNFAKTVASTASMRDKGVPLVEAQQLVSASLVAETAPEVSQQWMDYVAKIYSGSVKSWQIEPALQRNCTNL